MREEEAEKRLLILSEDILWKMHQLELECPHCGKLIVFDNEETYGTRDYFVLYGKDEDEIEAIREALYDEE